MFKFRSNLKVKEWNILRNFLKKNVRNDHPIINKKYFFWQFKVKKRINVFNLMYKKKIICIMGYLSLPMKFDIYKKIKSTWLLYWLADKKNSVGSGFYLLKKIEENNKFLFTLNASKIGKQLFNKSGWKSIDEINRNFIIFNVDKAKKLLMNKSYRKNISDFSLDKNSISNSYILNSLDIKKYAPNWKNFLYMKNSVIRSRQFLKWRYLDHPYFKYIISYEGNYKEPSVCVFRIEDYFGKFNGRIARIVDFFFPITKQGKKNAKKLLKNTFIYLKKINCEMVDYYSNFDINSKIFNSFSVSKKNFYKNIFIARFSPIKFENFKINFILNTPNLKQINVKNIYISKSDIDGDAPVRLT